MGIVKLTGNGEATVWLVMGHVRLGVDDVKVRHLEGVLIEGVHLDGFFVGLIEEVVGFDFKSGVLGERAANVCGIGINEEVDTLKLVSFIFQRV
jgi:hypothetical protein